MELREKVEQLNLRLAEREAELQKLGQCHQATLEIITLLNNDAPVEEMVRGTGAVLQRLIPCDRFTLGLAWLRRAYSLEGGRFTARTTDDSAPEKEGASASGWAAIHREPLLRRDIVAEKRFGLDEELLAEGMRAELIVPLVAAGRVIGTFGFTSRTPDQYQPAHLAMAQALGNAVAVLVKQLQSHQKLEETVASRTYRLQRQTDLQEALLNISRVVQQLQRPADLERLVRILDEQLRKLGLNFRTLAIHRLRSGQPPVFEAYEAQEGEEISRREKPHEPLLRIWKEGKTIYRPDLEQELLDLHPAEYDSLCTRYGMRLRSMLDVPYARGVLSLMSEPPKAFTAGEVTFVEQVSEVLSLGISRVEDLEAIQASRQALQESEERFRRLADATCEGIVISENGRILDVNRQLAELHGYTPEQLLGRELIELVAPEWREQVRERVAAEREETYEPVALRKDGSTFPVEVRGRTLIQGERRLRVTVVRDITEYRKALERQIHLERLGALGEMAQGVAHNFNNLMVGVLGYAQLIQLATDDPKIQEDAAQIVLSVDRAKDLVKRLNLAVRGGSEKVLPLKVGPVIEGAMLATRPRWKDEAEARGIHLEVVTRLAETPLISANHTRLHDILVNLILNAVDAMPEGGTIAIESRAGGDWVELTVRDTGVGMDAEMRKRVFEPFFTTKADVGTGLGLSAAYNTVIQWGGTIEIDSAPGKGTTVTMRFPAVEAGDVMVADQEFGPIGRISGGRILVVDDDEIVVTFLNDLLSMEHAVESVAGGKEALELFAPGRFQVALIDLGMPGMPGDRVAREMKRTDPAIVTVLVTGWELEEDDPRIAPFDFVLLKPFSFQMVDEIIVRALALQDQRSKELGQEAL